MACGKTVFFLLAIVASISCAPAEVEKNSSSREENGPPERKPPPYHQSPLDDNQERQNGHGQHYNHAQHDKAEVISSSKEENSPPKLETPQSPLNNNEDNSNLQAENFLPKLEEHHDKAGLFGLDFPNFGQLFSGFGGSSQDPLHQLINAFGTFFPGLGGSNSSGLPNLFSGFMPHSSRSQRIELPGDVTVENGTDHLSHHDKCFLYFLQSLLQGYGRNSANSYDTIGCNYTTQAGYSCSGCREQLLCDTNNVGRIRICPRSAPYCYNGVCGSVVNTTACTTTTG